MKKLFAILESFVLSAANSQVFTNFNFENRNLED